MMTTQFVSIRPTCTICHDPKCRTWLGAMCNDRLATYIPVASLFDPDALSHVASIFAPPIEDDAWLLAMPARSLERWYDWIV